MSQLSLPIPEFAPASETQRAPVKREEIEVSEGVSSPEEEKLELLVDKRPAGLSQAPSPARSIQIPYAIWPAALTWEAALAYTSLSPLQLRGFQKRGAISVRRAGRNGARIILRSELDQLLETLFAPTSIDIEENFDFG